MSGEPGRWSVGVRAGVAGDRRLRGEVCVIGAGPAGLVVALLLQQAQIPCVVLERLSSEAFYRVAGAGLIQDRTVRWLEAAAGRCRYGPGRRRRRW